jgi:hypothetical protein
VCGRQLTAMPRAEEKPGGPPRPAAAVVVHPTPPAAAAVAPNHDSVPTRAVTVASTPVVAMGPRAGGSQALAPRQEEGEPPATAATVTDPVVAAPPAAADDGPSESRTAGVTPITSAVCAPAPAAGGMSAELMSLALRKQPSMQEPSTTKQPRLEDPASWWKAPASALERPAKSGWLLKRKDSRATAWRHRWFVLWPSLVPDQAARRGGLVRQLLFNYDSPDAAKPRGVIPLAVGAFTVTSEVGSPYRGEDTLQIRVHSGQAKTATALPVTATGLRALKFYIIHAEDPGGMRLWYEAIRPLTELSEAVPSDTIPASGHPDTTAATQHGPRPSMAAGNVCDPGREMIHNYYRVACPQREKSPGVVDSVAWRSSPSWVARMRDDADVVGSLSESARRAMLDGALEGTVYKALHAQDGWVQVQASFGLLGWLPLECLVRCQHSSADHTNAFAADGLPVHEAIPPVSARQSVLDKVEWAASSSAQQCEQCRQHFNMYAHLYFSIQCTCQRTSLWTSAQCASTDGHWMHCCCPLYTQVSSQTSLPPLWADLLCCLQQQHATAARWCQD